jgi:ribosome-binding protein aMBF1 (putative translation factor)
VRLLWQAWRGAVAQAADGVLLGAVRRTSGMGYSSAAHIHPCSRNVEARGVKSKVSAPEEVAVLGEVIRQKRAVYGLSLREAAKLAGVNSSVLTRVEHGKQPSFANFMRIARWLGIET